METADIAAGDWPRAPWYVRLCARVFLRWFLRGKRSETYQCDGVINWLFPNELHQVSEWFQECRGKDACTADVQVPYYQLAHWMARSAGFEFSAYTMLQEWGTPEQIAALDAKRGDA